MDPHPSPEIEKSIGLLKVGEQCVNAELVELEIVKVETVEEDTPASVGEK